MTRSAWAAAMAAMVLAASAAHGQATGPVRLTPGAQWKPVDQPELKEQLEQAPPLKIEDLGSPVKALDNIEHSLVPNGHGWDFLVWYRKGYRNQTRVYMVDLASGEVKKQAFPDEEGRVRTEMGFTWWGVFAGDGKLYGTNLAVGGWDGVKAPVLLIYQYDPEARHVKIVHKMQGHAGERTPAVLSPNGWIYGAATYAGPDPNKEHQGKASAWGWNPVTGEYRDFGPIGKSTGMGYGYLAAADDRYVYVACGANPWYLTAVDVQTGKWQIIAEAPDGAYKDRMYLNSGRSTMPGYFGGAMVYIQTGDEKTRQYSWVWHGKLHPKKLQSFEWDDSCPWPKQASPMEKLGGAPPEIYADQLYPDENDRATVWWRPEKGTGAWKSIAIEGVQKHAMGVHRLVKLADGRLFGVSAGYQGRFVHDPRTGKTIEAGAQGGGSIYTMLEHQGKVYWSGYPSGPLFVYDPGRPWSLMAPRPPDAPTSKPAEDSAQSNPRRLTWEGDTDIVFHKTRVKKMLSSTLAADGHIYFGGKGQRDYEGGGLAWLEPNTGRIDGIWEPFPEREIGWVTTARNGRYVVAATEKGQVFLYDTAERKLAGSFTVVENARKAGPLLEVAEGLLLGETHDPNDNKAGILYGVSVPAGEVLFRRAIPATIPFNWNEGTDRWDYQLGPDGFIWTVLGKALVRIDPRDTRVHVVGKADSIGQFVFVGRDLYLSGAEPLRVVRNVVPE